MPFQIQEPFDDQGRSPALQRYHAARRLMEAGEFEQAASLFHQAAIDSPHFKTYELLGECYLRMKRFAEAIPYLASATTLNRGVRAPSLLAEAWLALDDPRTAIDAANIALERVPNNKAALRVRDVATLKVKPA